MKLVSFAVPCYNSAEYMDRCIQSLLKGGDDVEILIVNDGSKDDTGRIADEYAAKYPSVVRAIHQENKGHGGAVNTGLSQATGLYYKVVDSDDWVDEASLLLYLNKIRELTKDNIIPDMIATNYVYEHVEDDSSKIMRYTSVFPVEKVCTWEETKGLKTSQYLMMHAVTYRREMLIDCNLSLPEHTFYVDNIYVYYPLPYVKSIYYINTDMYRYYIGRSDQSVNEKVMASRVDQQVKITYIMLDCHDLNKVKEQSHVLYKNMFSSLSMMMVVSTIFLYIADGQENIEKKEKLWEYIKEKDAHLYATLKYRSLNVISSFPGYQGRKLTVSLYRLAQKIYKFN
ncbi:MAG: glycosyltransferase family 2 protein [Clostridia bacterium]